VPANDISTRVEAVAYALNDNPRGVNRLVISPLCRTLIVGMAGSYHLVKEEYGELRLKKDKCSNLRECLAHELIKDGPNAGARVAAARSIPEDDERGPAATSFCDPDR
jgi:hypothetical protein